MDRKLMALDAIVKFGLSVRQIPDKIIENWMISGNYSEKEFNEAKWTKAYPLDYSKFKNNARKGRYDFRVTKYENGFVYRKVIVNTIIPEFAGEWMVSKIDTSSSKVSWDFGTVCTAPSLEEAVAKWVSKHSKDFE